MRKILLLALVLAGCSRAPSDTSYIKYGWRSRGRIYVVDDTTKGVRCYVVYTSDISCVRLLTPFVEAQKAK